MADYQIFTPPREPRENELVNNVIFQALNDKSTVSARIMFMDGNLAIQLFFVEPSIFVRYDFLNNKWLLNSGEPIDITTVDLTIPEDIVSAATTKTSYFDLIAFEKGTTACKLAAANDARLLIRNAIINKGVTIPDGTTFRQYAGKIGEITVQQSDGGKVVDYDGGVNNAIEIKNVTDAKFVCFFMTSAIITPGLLYNGVATKKGGTFNGTAFGIETITGIDVKSENNSLYIVCSEYEFSKESELVLVAWI